MTLHLLQRRRRVARKPARTRPTLAADATYANTLLLARQLNVRLAAEHLAEHQNPATSAPTGGATRGTQFSANA